MLINPTKQGLSDKENGHRSRYALYQNRCPVMVEVTGLEPAASCSQTHL
nr:MAG TPA: holin [Caudoviricetes sp.]